MKKELFEEIGLEKIKEMTNDFINQVFDDIMIGFFFRNSDRNRVKEKEFEIMANLLGAKIPYTGNPIKSVHQKHKIMGGQFERRKQILKEVLEKYSVSQEIKKLILDHNEKLRDQVTKYKNADCD